MVDITSLCEYCKNYFPPKSKKPSGSYIHRGRFAISGSTISPLDFLKNGQYFRIVCSDLNDGVYCNTAEGMEALTDETFEGEIWEMAVPRGFIAIAEDKAAVEADISAISAKQGAYVSESFNGYSRSMGSDLPPALKSRYSNITKRLNLYRRIDV